MWFELKRKTIFVNEPFVYNGITLYQTDWDLLGLKLKVGSNEMVQLPVKKITTNTGKLWVGSIPVVGSNGSVLNYTVLISNLFGNLFLYNEQGQLVRECLIGQDVDLNSSLRINFSDLITTTGLQIKTDSGLPFVYFSFFVLMVSVYISFISYSQIWQLKLNSGLIVGGKSNRAILYFQEELKRMVQRYQ